MKDSRYRFTSKNHICLCICEGKFARLDKGAKSSRRIDAKAFWGGSFNRHNRK